MIKNGSLQERNHNAKIIESVYHKNWRSRRLRRLVTIRNISVVVTCVCVIAVRTWFTDTRVLSPIQEWLLLQPISTSKHQQAASTSTSTLTAISAAAASYPQVAGSQQRLLLTPRNRNRNSSATSKTSIASHILERDSNGLWTPLPQTLDNLQAIDEAFFRSSLPSSSLGLHLQSNDEMSTKRQEYLGVIRITKTGSTSLLNYFNHTKELQTFDKYLQFDAFQKGLSSSLEFQTPACVFGYHHHGGGTTNISKTKPRESYQCQHLSYKMLINYWTNSLRYLKEDDLGIQQQQQQQQQQAQRRSQQQLRASLLSLELTTIVRDPMERYLSYFHYWRYIYPGWNGLTKPAERSALVAGDFPAFLRQLKPRNYHHHDHHDRMNSAFQFEYLSEDVDYAIAMVEDMRVLPLVNECFNASILLLTHHYPQFFPRNETMMAFLNSSKAQKGNSRSHFQQKSTPERLAKRGLQPVQDFDLQHVKDNAREWLANDYRFYDACVSVFLRLLQKASPSMAQQCVQQIGSSHSSISL